MLIHANEENFDSLVDKELVVVDFFASWCGPCQMLTPVLEEIANDRSNVNIVKVDVDECTSLAKKYGIMSVPTLLLFKNRALISKRNGYMPKDELNSWIEENR